MHDEGPSTGVDIDPPALRWVGSVDPGCFLTFVPSGPFDPELVRIEAERAGARVSADQSSVKVVAALTGDDAVHLRLRYDDASRAAIRTFVAGLAQMLTDAGLSGALRRPRPEYAPEWVTSSILRDRAVSVFYAARTEIDGSFVQRLYQAHGLDQLAQHVASGGSEFTLAARIDKAFLSAIPELGTSVSLEGWSDASSGAALLSVGSRTASGWSCVDDWRAQAERARTALLQVGEDTDYAFAQTTSGRGRWTKVRSRPDGISGSSYVQRRDLWPRWVVDAHGLQVLTAEHLARAGTLDGWHTRRIGDRYLVEAKDLDPWFAGDRPDPEVLDRARADFGDMIITEDQLQALRAAERAAEIRAYRERQLRGDDG